VQFVLAHERPPGTVRFARLDGVFARRLFARHPALAGIDSVVWHAPGSGARREQVLLRSAAAIAALRYLGGPWAMLGAVLAVTPRFVRDALYDALARHRHRMPGLDACVVPTAAQRARFLDPDA
jgi:predicted DCC family thiol-disulfide oxidoreductase YuxK